MDNCPNCHMPQTEGVFIWADRARKFQCGSICNSLQNSLTVETKACEKIAALTLALLAYPEWTDDLDETGVPTGFVTCLVCEGGGYINRDGTYSKRTPPVHKPDCLRELALSHKRKDKDDAKIRDRR